MEEVRKKGEPAEINTKIEELNKVVQEIGAKMYQEAAAEQAKKQEAEAKKAGKAGAKEAGSKESGKEEEAETTKNGEKVVDAEFKDKKEEKKEEKK